MNKNVKKIILIVIACIACFVLGAFFGWPVDRAGSRGDISKAGRFHKAVITEEARLQQEYLQSDTAYRDQSLYAFTVMNSRVNEFLALAELTQSVVADNEAYADVLATLDAAQPIAANAVKAFEQTATDLDAILGGSVVPGYEQDANNAMLAYIKLQTANDVARQIVQVTDQQVGADTALLAVRDSWLSYDLVTAMLNDDERGVTNNVAIQRRLTEEQVTAAAVAPIGAKTMLPRLKQAQIIDNAIIGLYIPKFGIARKNMPLGLVDFAMKNGYDTPMYPLDLYDAVAASFIQFSASQAITDQEAKESVEKDRLRPQNLHAIEFSNNDELMLSFGDHPTLNQFIVGNTYITAGLVNASIQKLIWVANQTEFINVIRGLLKFIYHDNEVIKHALLSDEKLISAIFDNEKLLAFLRDDAKYVGIVDDLQQLKFYDRAELWHAIRKMPEIDAYFAQAAKTGRGSQAALEEALKVATDLYGLTKDQAELESFTTSLRQAMECYRKEEKLLDAILSDNKLYVVAILNNEKLTEAMKSDMQFMGLCYNNEKLVGQVIKEMKSIENLKKIGVWSRDAGKLGIATIGLYGGQYIASNLVGTVPRIMDLPSVTAANVAEVYGQVTKFLVQQAGRAPIYENTATEPVERVIFIDKLFKRYDGLEGQCVIGKNANPVIASIFIQAAPDVHAFADQKVLKAYSGPTIFTDFIKPDLYAVESEASQRWARPH